ncbi:MAG: adenylate/guanylate cyclase domain-containing protein [Brevinematia bacterium]
MKKSLNDIIIISTSAFLSVIVAYILSETVLYKLKDTIINGFFAIKGVSVSALSEGIQKIEVEGLNIASDDIIIVGIDDETLSKLGKFPFPRKYYDEYILRPLYTIENGKYPNNVFFDIVFSEYSSKEEDDTLFNSLSKVKSLFRVSFDYMFYFGTEGISTEEGLKLTHEINQKKLKEIEKFTIPKENIIGKMNTSVKVTRGNLPLIEITSNSWGIGFANILKYSEGSDTYNCVPMILEYNGKYYPSILLVLLVGYYETSLSNVFLYSGKEIVIKKSKVKYPDGTYKIKDVRIPVDDKNRFLINYVTRSRKTDPLGKIKTISLSKIPNVRGLGNFVDNKVLMIGMLSYGYGDIWKSPIADNMYGIEHLANALNNIIMANIQGYPGYVVFTPWYIILFLSFLLAGVSTLIIVINKSIILSLLEEIGIIIIFAFFVYFLFSQGTIIFKQPITETAYLTDVLKPTLSMVLAYVSGQVFVIYKERAQKLQIKGMLDSYVSPEVVNILLKNPEKFNLGGEDREITVFFSDIRGFTTLSEGLSPQELVSLINLYLSKMTDIIMDNRGTVDKYIGDAIMAFWGAPLDDPDHPFRACKASLEMLEALKEINSNLPPNKQLDIGIGINTGVATIGNMGSTKKKNYTAMGDTVNLASRLEGVNKLFHTRIIISENTFQRIKDKILARELDLIRVKGKKLPVKIYEVIGYIDDYKQIMEALNLSIENIQAEV